ncbi:MAG: hypothetical protein HDR03_03560 [Lachnospiraceae bacterium]|nr:hypothetical protein [Lachnospiraceae bacterium]
MYEYVEKSEYTPIRKELEEIIQRTQIVMRKNYGLTFQFHLIGSGKRHLITRIKGGNRGYDFDYNLILSPPNDGYRYVAKIIKDMFMASLKTALRGTEYSFPKDSTSSITIKVVDNNKKKIRYRCDFAIIYYGNNGNNDGYYYLRNNKERQSYDFVFRTLKSNIDEKVHAIIRDNGWSYIKEDYLFLKNINEGNKKHSFSLYAEAVNNVYNQMYLQ